jgi:8-oxo-dGTP pyrophosphatase MutT (NUDIX family)
MIWGAPRIETVQRIDYRVEPYVWSFVEEQAAEIDAHWDKLRATKPLLFNGRIMLMANYRIEDDVQGKVLRGIGFETDYKAFLAWRDLGFPDGNVMNCFAMAALRSADGAFMLGRMGEHTASAGRLYFPAGTPDRDDVKEGCIDLEGSALRELAEETGFLNSDITLSPEWTLVFEGARLACMKPVCAHQNTAALLKRFDDFRAQDKQPELTELVPVFSEADFDTLLMPGFMLNYMRQAF